MKIRKLIYLDRRNEEEVIEKSRSRRRIFVLSVILGAVGTLLLLMGGMLPSLLGTGCVIAFLYGFFLSFASGVPAFFERRPAKKYAGQTLLVFRTLTAKLATMGIVMATVSLLFTATLIVEGSGMTFSAMFQSRMEKASAFDLYIGTKNEAHLDAYQDQIRRSVPVTAVRRYAVYQGEDAQVTDYLVDHASYHKFSSRDMLMAFSDYAAPPGHEGVARSDSGNWGVSDPLPGLSGTVPGGLPAAHPDLRPDTGAGGDRDRPAESESVGCQWTRFCAGGARRAGPELSSQPRRHSRHDRETGEWGTVCGALCHPGPL